MVGTSDYVMVAVPGALSIDAGASHRRWWLARAQLGKSHRVTGGARPLSRKFCGSLRLAESMALTDQLGDRFEHLARAAVDAQGDRVTLVDLGRPAVDDDDGDAAAFGAVHETHTGVDGE